MLLKNTTYNNFYMDFYLYYIILEYISSGSKLLTRKSLFLFTSFILLDSDPIPLVVNFNSIVSGGSSSPVLFSIFGHDSSFGCFFLKFFLSS